MGREVYVVSEGLEEDVKMDRVEGGWYEGEGGVSAGVVQYRFRVVPREYTRAQVAPFTRLGWDERLCGREGLVTWPLKIDVKDLGRGERGGEEFVEWDKSGKEEAEVCEPAAKGEGGFGMACAAVLVVIVGIVARVVVSMGGKGEDLAEDLVEGEDEKEKIESVKDSVVSVSPSAQRSQQVGMDEILRHALGSSG